MCENLVIYIVCIWGPGLECLSSRATPQAHFKHTSSTLQAPQKHPSSTLQAPLKHAPSTLQALPPPLDTFLIDEDTFLPLFGVLIFDYEFYTFFDCFLLQISSIFKPLGPSKISVAPARKLNFHFFDHFFRGRVSTPKITPKLTPK